MSNKMTDEQKQRLAEIGRKIIRLYDEIDKLETEEAELSALEDPENE